MAKKAAADAKTDADFFLIARTDAIQVEGVDAAIERAIACVEAGADGIFAEAAYDLPTYQRFVEAVNSGRQDDPDFRHAAELQKVLDLALVTDRDRAEHRVG